MGVSKGSEAVRGPFGDEKGPQTAACIAICEVLHDLLPLLPVLLGGDEGAFGTVEAVEKIVALHGFRLDAAQDKMGLHTQPGSGDGGCSGVVGLHRTAGDEHVRLLRQGRPGHVFEFADFVAAQIHAAEVVPFDPDLRSAEIGTPAFEGFNRSGQIGQGQAFGYGPSH